MRPRLIRRKAPLQLSDWPDAIKASHERQLEAATDDELAQSSQCTADEHEAAAPSAAKRDAPTSIPVLARHKAAAPSSQLSQLDQVPTLAGSTGADQGMDEQDDPIEDTIDTSRHVVFKKSRKGKQVGHYVWVLASVLNMHSWFGLIIGHMHS